MPQSAAEYDYYLPIAAEAPSGMDALNYEIYVKSLADLFSHNDHNVLPAAVGIYAPWGSGKVRPHCFTVSGTAFCRYIHTFTFGVCLVATLDCFLPLYLTFPLNQGIA